jgi:DNA-binding NarL/FixJ family response regulator
MEVVGEARDGVEVPEAARRSRPDVVLMDVCMPNVDGIEATAQLGASGPVVVILSLYDDAETRDRALAAGATGFIAKHRPEGEMVREIRRAARLSGRPGDPR